MEHQTLQGLHRRAVPGPARHGRRHRENSVRGVPGNLDHQPGGGTPLTDRRRSHVSKQKLRQIQRSEVQRARNSVAGHGDSAGAEAVGGGPFVSVLLYVDGDRHASEPICKRRLPSD